MTRSHPGPRSSIRTSWLLLGTGPFIVLLILVVMYGTNVPHWDEWELTPLIQKYLDGTLALQDFFGQHVDHRIPISRATLLGLAILSRWNIWPELFLILALAVVVFILFTGLITRTHDIRHPRLIIAVAAVLVFSPAQWENWLSGWQVTWFLNVVAALVAVSLLTNREGPFVGRQKVLFASLAGLVAAYSLAQGLLIWPACLPAFLADKALRKHLPLWILLGIAVWGIYLNDFHRMPWHPEWDTLLDKPLVPVLYVLTYLGRPLTNRLAWSPYAGAVMVGVFVLATVALGRVRGNWQAAAPWTCLGLYVLLAASVTAAGRLSFGLVSASSPRYITISTLFLIATVVLTSIAVSLRESRQGALKLGVALIGIVSVIPFALNYRHGIEAMAAHHQLLVENQKCLQSAQSETLPCLKKSYPDGRVLLERVRYLRTLGWSFFGKENKRSRTVTNNSQR